MEVWPAQILRDEFVELVFAFFRGEFFKQGQPVGVRNVGCDLPAQCAVANRLQTRLESSENLVLSQVGELLTETLEIAEGVLVDDAGETEEFEQRILQRRGREKKLVAPLQRQLEGVRDDVRRLVNVAQSMRFIDDHQDPTAYSQHPTPCCAQSDRSR